MNIKSWLPFDRYTLVSRLSVAEVMSRLEANVTARKLNAVLFVQRYGTKKDSSDKPYKGVIKEQTFEIERIINYRNSFVPVIKGEVSHFLGQTEIKVKSSPHVAVLVFCAFWMSVVLLACLAVTAVMLRGGFEFPMLIPFGMLVFGCLLFTIPYKLEANKSKKFLATLLEGEEVKI